MELLSIISTCRSRNQHLSATLTVQRPVLLNAFQKAADGEPLPPLSGEDGQPLDIQIIIDDHAALIVDGDKRFRVPYAAFR